MKIHLFLERLQERANLLGVYLLSTEDPLNPSLINWDTGYHFSKFCNTDLDYRTLIKYCTFIMVHGSVIGHGDVVIFMDENKEIVAIYFGKCREEFIKNANTLHRVYGFPIKEFKKSDSIGSYIAVF